MNQYDDKQGNDLGLLTEYSGRAKARGLQSHATGDPVSPTVSRRAVAWACSPSAGRCVRGGAIAGALVLLTGCAADGTYRQLRHEYESGGETAYFRHVISRESVAPGAQDTELPDAEDALEASAQGLEDALGADGASNADVLKVPELPQNLEQELSQSADLDTLLGAVPALNPTVRSARENLRAALEQYSQATYLTDILKQYNAFTKQLDTRVGPQQHRDMVAMRFPGPGTDTLRARLVDQDAAIARREAEIALRDSASAMRVAYHDYLFVNAALRINRENEALLQQMIRVAQAKVRSDKASYSAVLNAQIELSKLADRIVTIAERRKVVVAEINTLLGRAPDAALGPPEPVAEMEPALPTAEVQAFAVRERQELQQQRFRVARMNTMVELATRMSRPEPTRGASYLETRMRVSGGTTTAAGSFMTRRDLDRKQASDFAMRDAYVREMTLRVKALERRLEGMEDAARNNVEKACFRLDRAKRDIVLHRTWLLPQARQALEASSAAYRAGTADFAVYLDAQRALLQLQLGEQGALRAFRDGLAELEQLVGRELPRKVFQFGQVGTSQNSSSRPEDKE